eukprot:Transcript_10092.p1 GENE.Transcript_10092~~Transcript_10092.p1  ORF type:complete len:504 (-),score=12.83 Transcript_10092:318-1829(-)
MQRWLKHERYRPLAECPGGVPHFWSDEGFAGEEPFGLCATDPAAFALVSGLVTELHETFKEGAQPSERPLYFHVGMDEAFDLCRERSRSVRKVDAWISWLTRLRAHLCLNDGAAAGEHITSLLVWGDFLKAHPSAVPLLPSDGSVVVCEWGYEAEHDFAPALTRLRAAGVPSFVCPGTSGWNSIAGRWTNAEANLRRAAEQGQAAGASGYVITDWGDTHHVQASFASMPGLIVGAACAWAGSTGANWPRALLAELLELHMLAPTAAADAEGPMMGTADAGVQSHSDSPGMTAENAVAGLGELCLKLGDAYRIGGQPVQIFNFSWLFWTLQFTGPLVDNRLTHAAVDIFAPGSLRTVGRMALHVISVAAGALDRAATTVGVQSLRPQSFGLGLRAEAFEAQARAVEAAAVNMRPEAALLFAEFKWTITALSLMCRVCAARCRAGWHQPLSNVRSEEAAALLCGAVAVREGFARIWRLRSREGGLNDALGLFERFEAELALAAQR